MGLPSNIQNKNYKESKSTMEFRDKYFKDLDPEDYPYYLQKLNVKDLRNYEQNVCWFFGVEETFMDFYEYKDHQKIIVSLKHQVRMLKKNLRKKDVRLKRSSRREIKKLEDLIELGTEKVELGKKIDKFFQEEIEHYFYDNSLPPEKYEYVVSTWNELIDLCEDFNAKYF